MDHPIHTSGRFKYLQKGKGTPVVLLHGLFGAMGNFAPLLDLLERDYQLTVPLLPIYELPSREVSILTLAQHVQDFLDHMGWKKVHLVGNSLGGHIGLLLTLEQQERIQTLTLTGSSGLFENALGTSFPRRQNYEFVKRVAGETFYDPNLATKEMVDEIFEIVNTPSKGLNIIVTAKSAMRHNLEHELDRIKVPTLLIWGRQDQITPPFVGEDFHQKIAHSTLHFFDKCGHAPMMEHPVRFAELLTAFLKKNPMT